ncbi:MAG: hypothetical protein ACXWT2_00435 [Methylovulum sp.]
MTSSKLDNLTAFQYLMRRYRHNKGMQERQLKPLLQNGKNQDFNTFKSDDAL